MTGITMIPSRSRSFKTCASIVVLGALFAGCRGSKDAASANEGFFEPVKTVSRPAPVKPQVAAGQTNNAGWDRMADSLLLRQKEQDQRLRDLSDQLQRLESSRKGAGRETPASTASPTIKPQLTEPRPISQPDSGIVGLFEAGRYQAAAEGLQALIQKGVPKDLEDQYHYMLGVSYLNLKQFDRAAISLKVITNRKGSKLRAEAYFILGRTYKQLGAGAMAKSMFESVLRESPKEPLASSAREELKALALKK
jgi:TolA-binding protein